MNTTDKPESMKHDTSRAKSFADVTYTFNRPAMEILLDFRCLPTIKIDAIYRLYKHDAAGVIRDLQDGFTGLILALQEKYVRVEGAQLVGVYITSNPYELKLVLNRNNCDIPVMFAQELKRYLSDEAGIILMRDRS